MVWESAGKTRPVAVGRGKPGKHQELKKPRGKEVSRSSLATNPPPSESHSGVSSKAPDPKHGAGLTHFLAPK